ncbi:hypothetical protein D3C86_2093650 [compost metagenome]
MIKKEDAFPVFFPNPAIAKSKIEGHMIDKNNPPEIKKNLAISGSGHANPNAIMVNPEIPKSINVFPAFLPPIKLTAINSKIQNG